jgi:hypothetical protein
VTTIELLNKYHNALAELVEAKPQPDLREENDVAASTECGERNGAGGPLSWSCRNLGHPRRFGHASPSENRPEQRSGAVPVEKGVPRAGCATGRDRRPNGREHPVNGSDRRQQRGGAAPESADPGTPIGEQSVCGPQEPGPATSKQRRRAPALQSTSQEEARPSKRVKKQAKTRRSVCQGAAEWTTLSGSLDDRGPDSDSG